VISEAFKTAVWDYRRRGGKLYMLALDHGMSPSTLSASVNGLRKVDDERLVSIGLALGLRREDVFDHSEIVAP
jgi:hypothetical protein